MSDDRTALEHLLDGRDALLHEVQRLNTAIEELDAVINRLGGGDRRTEPSSSGNGTQRGGTWGSSSDRTTGLATSRGVGITEPIAPDASRRRGGVRTAPDSAEADPPKSIRVHVLDMLAAEDREFGLAELIDGVHEAGIQAHDDAVRSITIKLMKDGKVERVGRGQYRLSRRGSRPAADDTAHNDAAHDDTAQNETDAVRATDDGVADAPQLPTGSDERDEPGDAQAAAVPPAGQTGDQQPATQHDAAPQGGYTPPLNLGQPWSR